MSRRFKGIDVDDVIQEMYVTLSGLKSVENIRNPKQYAYQTAYSIVLTQLQRSRVVSITPVADLDIFAAKSEAPSPEAAASTREELRGVTEALKTLSRRVYEVFTLRRIEGLSQREVAQRLGISENIVEKCVAQGVADLAIALRRGGKLPLNRLGTNEIADLITVLPHAFQKGGGKKSN